MAKVILYQRLRMELNLGSPQQTIGWATVSRDTETKKATIEIELDESVSEQLDNLVEICDLKAIGFAGLMRKPSEDRQVVLTTSNADEAFSELRRRRATGEDGWDMAEVRGLTSPPRTVDLYCVFRKKRR